MTPCSCHRDPTILRLSLPPGTAPEVVALLVQAAVAEHYRRRHALDFPAVATPDQRRADIAECIRFNEQRRAM